MIQLNYNAILDNITEGYPVELTRANGMKCIVRMERVMGDENYMATVDGVTLCTSNFDSLFAKLSAYKYTAVKY